MSSIFKVCSLCYKVFYARSTYYLHRKICHEKELLSTKKEDLRECECGKSFHARSTYYHHRKLCNEAVRVNHLPQNFACQEENCHFTCSRHTEFLNHLKTTHEIEPSWLEKTFQNYAEFEEWKDEYEKFTKATFIIKSTKQYKYGKFIYFECNRSGCFTSKSTGKRALRSQGSVKIGFKCPANMKVQFDEKSFNIKATICCLHYKHNIFCPQKLKKEGHVIASQSYVKKEYSDVQRNNDEHFASSPMKLKTCPENLKIEITRNCNITQTHQESKIHETDTRDLEYQNENSFCVENQISMQSANEDSGLNALKYSMLSKIVALCDSVKTCNSQDVLLSARVLINRATAVLNVKKGTVTSKTLMPDSKKNKTSVKPCRTFTAKLNKNSQNIKLVTPLCGQTIILNEEISSDSIMHENEDDYVYTLIS